ncbi:carboxylate-amine ligase [Pseudomonas sp.]|uniref:carboxylate-amine ligase n=1 Tax=Pseudomonas sp. TaxID=306 RepID=UPI003D0CDC68
MPSRSSLTFGIEEEYFLTDLASRRIPHAPVPGFAEACQAVLGSLVTREMFAAQFEVVTPVLHSLDQARECLTEARTNLARVARDFGLGLVAAGTQPLAQWRQQRPTDVARYQQLFDDFQMVASRSVLAGLHVHVGVPEDIDRIRAMNRVTPWLPLLLGLSASSPFWAGKPSGLMSYRQAVCDEWPRMGIPDHFDNDAEYQRYVQLLLDTGSIRTSADVWWNIRPSVRYPTLELRIADACPQLDDALCIAGLFRAMVSHALHAPRPDWVDDPMTRVITLENRWRAKRQGLRGAFIDPATQRALPFADWLENVLQEVLVYTVSGDEPALQHARTLAREGGSAEAQLATYQQARDAGRGHGEALVQVVDALMAQTELQGVAEGRRIA